MIFCSHFNLPNILTLLEFLWQKLQPSINLSTSQAVFFMPWQLPFLSFPGIFRAKINRPNHQTPRSCWRFLSTDWTNRFPCFRGIFLWGIYLWMLMIILCNHRNCEDFSISTLVQKFPSAKKWGGAASVSTFYWYILPPKKNERMSQKKHHLERKFHLLTIDFQEKTR